MLNGSATHLCRIIRHLGSGIVNTTIRKRVQEPSREVRDSVARASVFQANPSRSVLTTSARNTKLEISANSALRRRCADAGQSVRSALKLCSSLSCVRR
jgi:hypothetical protein